MNNIYLKEINEENFDKVLKLSETLTDEQKKCVAPNIYSLAQAYLYQKIAWPRAIYNNDELIGFIMLGLDNYIADEKDHPVYFLWRFMIAKPYQSKGYGKLVLDLICQKCKDENINYLYLSCHYDTIMPYQFYIKYGFEDTNRVEDGEKVLKFKIK